MIFTVSLLANHEMIWLHVEMNEFVDERDDESFTRNLPVLWILNGISN